MRVVGFILCASKAVQSYRRRILCAASPATTMKIRLKTRPEETSLAILRTAERLCMVIGLAALATYGVMLAHSKVFQIYDRWAFRGDLHSENSPAKEIPEIPSVIGLLEIPAIDLSVMVLRGTNEWTLN